MGMQIPLVPSGVVAVLVALLVHLHAVSIELGLDVKRQVIHQLRNLQQEFNVGETHDDVRMSIIM